VYIYYSVKIVQDEVGVCSFKEDSQRNVTKKVNNYGSHDTACHAQTREAQKAYLLCTQAQFKVIQWK